MNAGQRVVSSAGWVLGLWLLFVALAEISAMLVGTAAAAAAEPYAGPVPGREDLFALIQLSYLNRGVFALAASAPAVTAMLGAAIWTVVAGLVIARLDGRRGAASLGETWLRTLPAVIVQSLWHLLVRAIAVMLIAVSLGPLSPLVMLGTLAIGWWIASLALDLTRAGVVLHAAHPWHPATALFAFVRAATQPRLLGITLALNVAQLGCIAGITWVALHAIGPGHSKIAVSVIALVGVTIGVLRLSFVVGHGRVALHSNAHRHSRS